MVGSSGVALRSPATIVTERAAGGSSASVFRIWRAWHVLTESSVVQGLGHVRESQGRSSLLLARWVAITSTGPASEARKTR